MAFNQDDRSYIKDTIGAAVNPLSKGIDLLNDQMKAHDDETKKINDTQQQMIGAWSTVKYMILPVAIALVVSFITWHFTKS